MTKRRVTSSFPHPAASEITPASVAADRRNVLKLLAAGGAGPVVAAWAARDAKASMVQAPGKFAAHVMVGPSPCYINDGDYIGGFSREDIESLLDTLESNYLGWSSTMAPAIMGNPERPELAEELSNSFCRTDPEIAKHFARVTFLSDHRAQLQQLTTPSLILQCDEDMIAPVAVGEYMHRMLPNSTLKIIENVGHCPHLSQPSASADAIDQFLAEHRL